MRDTLDMVRFAVRLASEDGFSSRTIKAAVDIELNMIRQARIREMKRQNGRMAA